MVTQIWPRYLLNVATRFAATKSAVMRWQQSGEAMPSVRELWRATLNGFPCYQGLEGCWKNLFDGKFQCTREGFIGREQVGDL